MRYEASLSSILIHGGTTIEPLIVQSFLFRSHSEMQGASDLDVMDGRTTFVFY